MSFSRWVSDQEVILWKSPFEVCSKFHSPNESNGFQPWNGRWLRDSAIRPIFKGSLVQSQANSTHTQSLDLNMGIDDRNQINCNVIRALRRHGGNS